MPLHRVFKMSVPPMGTIVFMPDEEKLFLVDDASTIPDEIMSETPIPSFTRLPDFTYRAAHLILNNLCNLQCTYCYANAGDSTPIEMSPMVMRATITKIVSDTITLGQSIFELGFIGGEPTLSLALMNEGEQLARQLAAEAGIRARVGIVSNGYYSADVGDYILKYLDYATISLDGPQEIQDHQRPTRGGRGSFAQVYNNAQRLYDAGFPLGIRCTISRESVNRLPQIIEFLHNSFPKSVIGLEPLQECGRCALTHACGPNPEELVDQMIEVLKLVLSRQIKLKSSILRFKIQGSDISFCGVNGQNFAVTPQGYVTACTRVISHQERSAQIFHYGSYDHNLNRFVFDTVRYAWLKKIVVDSIEQCADCFARYNCKGDCAAIKADAYGDVLITQPSPRCSSIRRLTEALFRLRVGLEPAASK